MNDKDVLKMYRQIFSSMELDILTNENGIREIVFLDGSLRDKRIIDKFQDLINIDSDNIANESVNPTRDLFDKYRDKSHQNILDDYSIKVEYSKNMMFTYGYCNEEYEKVAGYSDPESKFEYYYEKLNTQDLQLALTGLRENIHIMLVIHNDFRYLLYVTLEDQLALTLTHGTDLLKDIVVKNTDLRNNIVMITNLETRELEEGTFEYYDNTVKSKR